MKIPHVAPMAPDTFTSPSGITVTRTISKVPYQRGLKTILRKLDAQRGIYLSSEIGRAHV